MKKFLAALFLLLASAPAVAQNGANVRQSGNVTPGHVPMWTTNGAIQDGGTAAQGFLTSLGVTNNGGPGICLNSAPITQPYNRMCLSVGSTGVASLTLEALGGATPQSFEIIVNGTVFPFPGIGLGDVTGPASCTDNALTRFNGTSGKLIQCSTAFLSDAGAITAAGYIVDTTQNLGASYIQSFSFHQQILGGSISDPIAYGGDWRIVDFSATQMDGLHLYYQTGVGWQSPKNGFGIFALIGADYTGSLANNSLVGMQVNVEGLAAISGGATRGDTITVFGLNPYVWAAAGSGPYFAAVGGEVDIGISNTATVKERIGWQVISAPPQNGTVGDNGKRGSLLDVAFTVGKFSGSATWGEGYSWYGDAFDNTSRIMYGPVTAALDGINFTNVVFTSAAFSSNGFAVDPNGSVFAPSIHLIGTGQAIIAAPASGTPTVTLGSSSGTPVVTATSPCVITAATGNLVCTFASNTLTSAHIFVGNGSNVATDVAMSGDISITNTGATTLVTGSASNLNSGTLAGGRLPGFTGGDVTSSAGSLVLTIANNAVTLAKLATQAANTVLGNATAGTAVPTALAMPNCAGAATCALQWTAATGFVNNTSITAAAMPASGLTGQVLLANGGTSANLTASNGGIFYSTASAGAILSGTATARQMLQSGASGAPAWSTTTWPATAAVNRLLYASSVNVISDLVTAANNILVSDGSGTPMWASLLPAFTLGGTVSGGGNQINNVIIGNTTPLAGTFTTVTGVKTVLTNNASTSGAGGINAVVTQTQPNSTDLVDSAINLTWTLSAVSATNELVPRVFNLLAVNTLTGGGAVTTARIVELAYGTSASTTTTEYNLIYMVNGATSGTVTTGYGLRIASLQGTTKWGIADDSGANWYNTGFIKTGVVAVASLPTCNSGAKGARHFVNDSNATSLTVDIGAIVAAGGTTNVPVVCDGTNWRIGANDNIPLDDRRKFA